MTLTTIEKAAKLMGKEFYENFLNLAPAVENWNPLANKEDLSDVIDELEIDIVWIENMSGDVVAAGAEKWAYGLLEVASSQPITNHPNKFTAKAHAVMTVVEQIYDRREN